ncbi:MAG: NACHT domain-containing protein, partial [Chloroflexi bacterium]
RLLNRMVEDDPQAHFLAVVGPSGSGKSSVVKAGLLPALRHGRLPRSETWFFAEMSPGNHPMHELESALLSVATSPVHNLAQTLALDSKGLARAINQIVPQGHEMLLIIDQFEEVFTQVPQEAERAAFLASLQAAMNDPTCRLRVIITLRADFYDRPLMYEGFADLMRRRTEVVVPLTTSELEEAIIAPVRRLGIGVEPELLAAIIADISQEPGTLPLLQYALTEVFERREGNTLTLSAYQASGGALGALARRAQELYEAMDSDRQALVRQLFLRLVNIGDGTEDTRRRLSWEELTSFAGDGPDLQYVLDTFGKYRLLSFDRDPITRAPTVEIAHEALIREWVQLRDWLSSSREDVRMQRRLSNAATIWREADRNPGYLLGGAQLEEMESWAVTTDLALTDEERGFLAASIVARRAQEAREEARRRLREAQERRSRIRLQILVGVLAVVAGVTLGLSAFTLIRANNAEARAATATVALGQEQARAATLEAAAVRGENLAAEVYRSRLIALYAQQAAADGDEALALALAYAAVQIDGAPDEAWAQLAQLLDMPAGSDRPTLLAAAEAAEIRPLTCEERARYSVLPEC